MNNKHSKKKLLQKIQKMQQRKHVFKCVAMQIGRGGKKSLVRVHEANEDLKIQRTYVRNE